MVAMQIGDAAPTPMQTNELSSPFSVRSMFYAYVHLIILYKASTVSDEFVVLCTEPVRVRPLLVALLVRGRTLDHPHHA